MKRNHSLTIITSLILIISLASCDAFLNPGSLFAALDKPDTGAISKMTGTELLDALAEQDGSETFYDELSDAEAARIDAELAILEQSGDASKASEAGLARVELTVMTNPVVRDTVNSIADLLIQDEGSAMDTAAIVGKLTAALEPIKGDENALAEFLRDMSVISNSYSKVTSSGEVGAGDMQTFMVAAVFATIVDVYPDENNAAAALVLFLAAPADPLATTLLDPANGCLALDEDDFQERITDAGGKVDTLNIIARLAGLEALATTITDALDGNTAT